MSWNKQREVLVNIIEMYKDMPYLWHKSHADYKNKYLREDGFNVLLHMYRNFDPDADIKIIKKKLENMRTTYLKEEKKVNASKQTGAGSEDVYVPTLWYYEAFSFLRSTTEACHTVRDSLENENSSLSATEDDISQPSTSSGLNSNKRKKKRLSLSKRQANIMEMAEKLMSMKEEEWEVLGKSIGLQLKDLDKRALTITQKIISDAIYYAKIGKLTEDSYIALGSTNGTQNNSNYYPFPHHRSQSSLSFHTPSSPYSVTPDSSSSSSASMLRTQSPHQLQVHHPSNHIQSPCPSPRTRAQTPHPLQHIQETGNFHLTSPRLIDSQLPSHSAQSPRPLSSHSPPPPSPSPHHMVQTQLSSDHTNQSPHSSSHNPSQTPHPLPHNQDEDLDYPTNCSS